MDVERFLGVLYGRIKIVWHEVNYRNNDDIVGMSNNCIILYNLIVGMKQNGILKDEERVVEEGVEIEIEDEGEWCATTGVVKSGSGSEDHKLQGERDEIEVMEEMMKRESEYWKVRK